MTTKAHAQISRASTATSRLVEILHSNHAGRSVGVVSICSANRYVLEAAMVGALGDSSLLLVESTSNQVNQFGGYTGQTPADFAAFVRALAAQTKFPRERILLGGDHLGPHVWRNESASRAIEKGCRLVRDYVLAGFGKIHLDSSMRCADDPVPLPEETISARAAQLCEAAEAAREDLPDDSPRPVYVVGSEVPIPGGSRAERAAPEVTRVEDLELTLELTKAAFLRERLGAAWDRVIAVVVEPGVEFTDSSVFAYDSGKVQALANYLQKHWTGVFEAHSTDYQTTAALEQMVRDHFAILKVGPWLTFAFREAVFALEAIEKEWLGGQRGAIVSGVREALEQAMIENPTYWKDHYQGSEEALRFARKYSLSDRARYYWPQNSVSAALEQLISNLTAHPAPASLISQYLPVQSEELRSGTLKNHPLELIRSKITEVLHHYASACGTRCGRPVSAGVADAK